MIVQLDSLRRVARLIDMAVGTTRGKRRLGRYLRPYFEQTGLKLEELAKRARCSRQTASRLFSGDNLPRYHLFTTLLTEIGVTGADRDRALELWEIAGADTVTIERADDLLPAYRRFRMDEQEAMREKTLDPMIIPGMLQTPAYAAAIALADRERWRDDWNSEALVAERRDRQSLLVRDVEPLELHAVLDESTLCRAIGGREVMAEQLDHLLEMGRRPNVTIQILPWSLGAYGPMTGPLTILTYPEDDEPESVYVESLAGLSTVEQHEDVAALSAVWDGAAAVALSARKSMETIRAVRAKGP